MPAEASENESNAPESEAEDQGFLLRNSSALATFATFFVGTLIVQIIISRMWDEDEIRLYALDAMMRFFQLFARMFGGWALTCEKAYNDYANALH
jgi:hypothetical protein